MKNKKYILEAVFLTVVTVMMAVNGVVWQDIVFAVGNLVALASTVITVMAKPHEKQKRRVAFRVAGMLTAFCVPYASYKLWYSLSICAINAILHYIIGFQRRV